MQGSEVLAYIFMQSYTNHKDSFGGKALLTGCAVHTYIHTTAYNKCSYCLEINLIMNFQILYLPL